MLLYAWPRPAACCAAWAGAQLLGCAVKGSPLLCTMVLGAFSQCRAGEGSPVGLQGCWHFPLWPEGLGQVSGTSRARTRDRAALESRLREMLLPRVAWDLSRFPAWLQTFAQPEDLAMPEEAEQHCQTPALPGPPCRGQGQVTDLGGCLWGQPWLLGLILSP